MKKINIIEKVSILFLVIVVISTIVYLLVNFVFNKKEDENLEVVKKTSKFEYVLYVDDSTYYKTEFENLIDILSEEELKYQKYAKAISKLFIIDFYTLNNKKHSYDVGGIQFVHKDLKDNLIVNASNTLYKYINNKEFEYPIVKNVSVTGIEEIKYEYDEKEYEAYSIDMEWDYEKELDYEKTSELILIKEDKQLFVVEKKEL